MWQPTLALFLSLFAPGLAGLALAPPLRALPQVVHHDEVGSHCDERW